MTDTMLQTRAGALLRAHHTMAQEYERWKTVIQLATHAS